MYEDKLLLTIRVERLKGNRTFSQKPKSRCHHVLQAPQIDSRDEAANAYVTWTSMHYVETRGDEQTLFAAWATHTLTVEDGRLQDQAEARRSRQLRRRLRQHPAVHLSMGRATSFSVMIGLVPVIHAAPPLGHLKIFREFDDVDDRDKPGHDGSPTPADAHQ